MKASRHTVCLALLTMASSVCPAADQKKDEVVELSPWKHEFYWVEFTVTKDKPGAEDGRYRLRSVRKDGDVELFYLATPEQKEVVVVKPMPKKFVKGDRPPTIVVKASDAAKQSATLRELRMK